MHPTLQRPSHTYRARRAIRQPLTDRRSQTAHPHLHRGDDAAPALQEDPLDTRALTGLASILFASGCALGAAALHPAVNDSPLGSELGRAAVLLAVASLPAWIASSMRRAAEATEGQLTDAHLAGYRLALQHLEKPAAGYAPGGEGLRGNPQQDFTETRQTERHDQ
jgi:hypothetical protein